VRVIASAVAESVVVSADGRGVDGPTRPGAVFDLVGVVGNIDENICGIVTSVYEVVWITMYLTLFAQTGRHSSFRV
jgi:hypothetical protein